MTTRSPEGQAGVEAAEGVSALTPQGVNPKRSAMDEIVANSRAAMAEEYGDPVPVPDGEPELTPTEQADDKPPVVEEPEADKEEKDEPAAPAADEEPTPVETPSEQAAEPKPVEIAPEALVKVKVNGQERLIPYGEAIKSIQLAAASAERFAQARAMVDEAKRIQAETAAKAASPEPATVEEKPAAPSDLDPVAIARAIQYGTDQEAADVIARLIATRPQPSQQQQFDPAAIATQAAEQATAQITYQHALKTFDTEYSDILADGRLTMLAANTVHAMKQQDLMDLGYDVQKMSREDMNGTYLQEQRQGHVKPDLDLFRAAGNLTRDWVKAQAKNLGGTATPAAALDKRQERKRTLDTPPPAKGAKADLGKEEARPPSGSQIVQQMRKARGLPL